MFVSIIEVEAPKIPNTTNLYEVNANTFQFPESAILLDILHRVNHKTLQHLNILILNAKNVPCSIGKNMPIASMCPVGKCKEAQQASWSRPQCDTSKLLPQILQDTILQLELDTKGLASSIPAVDISRRPGQSSRNPQTRNTYKWSHKMQWISAGPTWSNWNSYGGSTNHIQTIHSTTVIL